MARDGRSVTASAHAHGPACSSVRKTVDFALAPGHYVLQIAGVEAGEVVLEAVRLP